MIAGTVLLFWRLLPIVGLIIGPMAILCVAIARLPELPPWLPLALAGQSALLGIALCALAVTRLDGAIGRLTWPRGSALLASLIVMVGGGTVLFALVAGSVIGSTALSFLDPRVLSGRLILVPLGLPASLGVAWALGRLWRLHRRGRSTALQWLTLAALQAMILFAFFTGVVPGDQLQAIATLGERHLAPLIAFYRPSHGANLAVALWIETVGLLTLAALLASTVAWAGERLGLPPGTLPPLRAAPVAATVAVFE